MSLDESLPITVLFNFKVWSFVVLWREVAGCKMAHSDKHLCAKCGTEYKPTRGGWHTPPYKVHKVHDAYVTFRSDILCDACYKKITRVRSRPLRSNRGLSARVHVCTGPEEACT
jgi:hypothetical protein